MTSDPPFCLPRCNCNSFELHTLAVGHLAEAVQDVLHLFVAPEEVGERLLHRVEISQGLVLLHDQLLDGVVGERLLLLVVLWRTHRDKNTP